MATRMKPSNAAVQPWDRRHGETPQAFAALKAYLELGPTRSIEGVWAKVGDGSGKSGRHLERWSSRWAWVERARSWDSHRAAVEQEAKDRVAAKQAAQWEQRRLKLCEETYQLAQRLRDRVGLMLQFPLSTTRTSKDGKKVIIKPARWTMANLVTMAKAIAELESLAIREAIGDADGFNPLTATPEECRAYLVRQGLASTLAPTSK